MPIASQNSLPGEKPGDKLARIVRSYVGCSLLKDRERLGKLVGRGVDDPARAVTVKTNCGTSALGVMAEAGVEHALLDAPYLSKTGLAPGANAIAWLLQIARERGALVTLKTPGVLVPKPPTGALLHYNHPGTNNDHVEWLLSEVAPSGAADMAGGGRPNNAITQGRGAVAYNNGRPLLHFIDPAKLGIEELLPTSDMNEAYPDA